MIFITSEDLFLATKYGGTLLVSVSSVAYLQSRV